MKRLAALALLLTLAAGCGSPRTQSGSRTVFAMDTVMTITAYGENAITSVSLRAAEDEIHRLDRLLSVTDPGSDIAVLNRTRDAEVSNETAALLRRALEVSQMTGGAYDPTLGRISEAWGFRSGDPHIPEAGSIETLLFSCGCDRVEISGNRAQIGADMALDLGGIAKGYAAERVMEVLRESGVGSAVFSLGGNVGALGQKPGGGPWRVAIEDPDQSGGHAAVLSLEGGLYAVTSGAYERFFEEDGVIYHHILDPETGCPARSDLKSVTVVSPDGTLADGLSTALFVMGFERASDFWKRHCEDFQMVLITGDGLYVTPDLSVESDRAVTVLETSP